MTSPTAKVPEQALTNSEELVRLILDSAAEAIFGCDPEGTCLICNRAAVRLLGYDDPAELLGKNMHSLEHHTRADGTPYPIEECPIYIGFQKGQEVHRDDELYWRKDGTSFPVEFWSHPIFRDGRTLGAVITFIDITERKRAEEALRKNEARLRTLLEINNAIIINLTQEALLHAVSESLNRVVPFDRASLALYVPEKQTFRLLAMESKFEWDHLRVGVEYKRGKSIGTLNLGSRTKNQYSEADLEFLQEVANQVAPAVENMQSYQEIAALKAKLEKENVYLR